MPAMSILERMSRNGDDLSQFVKLWRSCKKGSAEEAALLRRFKCGFKTAYRVLGPKIHAKKQGDLRITRSKAGANKGEGNYKARRAKELEQARAEWKPILKERKEAERAGRDVYAGEMHPEGAPLRAVGF